MPTTVSLVLFLLCAVILVLMVLIQRGRGGGLAGAFGGPGGHSAFGTKTADVFIKATAVLGAIFFILAIVTTLLSRYQQSESWTEEPPTAEVPAQPGAAPGETPTEQSPQTPSETPAETPASESSGPAVPATPKAPDTGAPDAGSP